MPTDTIADVATASPPTDSSVVSTSNGSAVSTPRDNTSMVITGAHHDKLLWARVMASKAHAETTYIAKRMGKMEELEKGMALLEKMRPVIGEELYANLVRSLLQPYQTSKPLTVLLTSSMSTSLLPMTSGGPQRGVCPLMKILGTQPRGTRKTTTLTATSMMASLSMTTTDHPMIMMTERKRTKKMKQQAKQMMSMTTTTHT